MLMGALLRGVSHSFSIMRLKVVMSIALLPNILNHKALLCAEF